MNRDGDKSAKTALRSQKQPKAQQHVSVQKKKKDPTLKDAKSVSQSCQGDSDREVKSTGLQGKRAVKVSPGAAVEGQRKLSDASNASEDLSKDSGCPSGKLSTSDSSSEISDCPSEGNNKHDSPSSDNDLSWIDGGAHLIPESDGRADGRRCVKVPRDSCSLQPDAAGAGLSLFNSTGSFMDLMMGETTEDLVREVEDLRSENEYLKDEVEELRCEMLEMRDMFQEEEVYQLQELRLQLEQANKSCRILQYRLRKAERRSIRVAQTGQVDGELVLSLEHDIKVAKSVSLRLYNELEAMRKKDSRLEWENEALREKTQELEVAKQVLQAEVEKTRESTLKKKSMRSSASRAEKRLSQQIEDDSADLRCQLHFAKEELALMCKKLTKLVSESEGMREELAKYHSAYGDIDTTHSPEGKQNSAHAREAGVRVHLKLVEEEATLLSRRIVELEVENRGLRAEMSDLREKMGRGGGEEEEEENRDVLEENLSVSTGVMDRKRNINKGCTSFEQGQDKEAEKGRSDAETSSQTDGMSACHITREGPVGGEWDPSDSHESGNNKKTDRGLKGMTVKDYETLLSLRDHSSILSSAIQLLTTQPKNGQSVSTSCAFTSPTEVDLNDKAHKIYPPSNEALELLQAMLLAFIGRVETLLTGEDFGKLSVHRDGHVWDSCAFSFLSGDCTDRDLRESPSTQESVEDLRTSEVKEREKQKRQSTSFQSDLIHSCRDPKMRLCLQVLWILHQWCQVKGPGLEGKEGKDKTMSVLRGLLQDLGSEIQEEWIEFNSEAKGTQGKAAECGAFHDGADRMSSSNLKSLRRQFSPHGCKRKNWCYLSQEAAQLDREDPVKTWDHLIMPLSFPDLDFERMSMERSHTAPGEIRRPHLLQPPVSSQSPAGSAEAKPSRRQTVCQLWLSVVHAGDLLLSALSGLSCQPQRRHEGNDGQLEADGSGRFTGEEKEITAAVGGRGLFRDSDPREATDGECWSADRRVSQCQKQSIPGPEHLPGYRPPTPHLNLPRRGNKPSREVQSLHLLPKCYRRHSASGTYSPTSSTNLSSCSSSSSTSRDRALWSQNHHSHPNLTWTRQTTNRSCAGLNHSSLNSLKPPSKPAGGNRYGMVTEFLRRVSGRAEKPVPVPGSGQKTKNGLKNLERVPTRPPAAPLHRTDSVTRIVNQRFMKQREEAGRAQKEEKGSSQSLGVRRSPSTVTIEDGNYDHSSSSTLTFCFARPSRSTQKQTSNQNKLLRHRYSPPSSTAAHSDCE